jgi:hypothetical protein
LVVTGTAGIGKSVLCARLAGTIPGVLCLDVDVLAADLVSVVSPNPDYPAFWRSMMRLAHELAQNQVVVVYFATMLPEQLLASSDLLGYFGPVSFLYLTCPAETLRSRLARREPGAFAARLDMWVEFDDALRASASSIPTATIVDAGRTMSEVEREVLRWIDTQLVEHGASGSNPTT